MHDILNWIATRILLLSRTLNGLLAPSPDKAKEAAGQKSTYQCWFHHLSEYPQWSQTGRTGVSRRISGQPRNSLGKFKQESFTLEWVYKESNSICRNLITEAEDWFWPPGTSGWKPGSPKHHLLTKRQLPPHSWLACLILAPPPSLPAPPTAPAGLCSFHRTPDFCLPKRPLGPTNILGNKSCFEGWPSIL